LQDIFTKLMSEDISKEDNSDSEENPIREAVDFLVDQVCLQESYEGKSRKRTRVCPLGLDDDYITPKALKSSRGFRIPQFDGADDSSSDSESADKSDEVNVEVETSLTRKRSTMDSHSDEGPVKCVSCKRTYRTKVSYDKHLPSCTEVSSESSDESSESPTTSRVSTKTSKYGTVVVKTKLVVMQSPDKNQKRKREAKAVRKAVKLAAKPADSTTKTLIQQQPPQSMNAHYHQHQQISTTMNDKQNFAPAPMYQEQAPIVMGQNPIYVTQPTVYYINVTPSKQNYLLLNSPDGQQNLVYVQGMEQEASPIILPQSYGNMMLPSYNGNTTFLTQSPFLQNMGYSPMMNDAPQLVNTPNGLFLSNPAAAQSPFTINQSPFITTSTPTMQNMSHLLPNLGLGAHDLGPTFTPDLQIKQEPNPTIQIINPSLLQKPIEFQQPAPPPPLQMQAPMQPPLINLSQYLAPPANQQPQVPAFMQQPQQLLRQPFIQMPNQNFMPPNGMILKRQPNSTVTNIQKMQMISSSISPRTCQVKTATRSYVEIPPKPTEKVAPMPKILPNPPPLCVKEKPVKLCPSPAPPQNDPDAPKVVKITASANVGTQTTPRCITPSIVKKEPTDVEDKTGIQFKIQSSDGFVTTAHNVSQAWQNIFDAVQTARKAYNLTPLPYNPFSLSGQQMTGLGQDPIKYLIEQLPGVTK
jgi:F/Y rich C-terminus